MAKLTRIEKGIKPEVKQPVRKLNIFQKGVKSIIHFIRPVKPDLSTTGTSSDPESSGNTIPDPEEEVTVDPGTGGTAVQDPDENTSGTNPGADPTNTVNTEDMEPFIGEIRMFAGNFAPRGWALCDGQSLEITTYPALYSLLGTFYGGDGRVNFKLPDLRGRVPIHQGPGPGLTPHPIGSAGGTENVSLSINQMPTHSHDVKYSTNPADSKSPENNLLSAGDHNHYSNGQTGVKTGPQMIADCGGGLPHTNMQPYLAINYIIALEGIFPPRS